MKLVKRLAQRVVIGLVSASTRAPLAPSMGLSIHRSLIIRELPHTVHLLPTVS
jgi:hypothetical protein